MLTLIYSRLWMKKSQKQLNFSKLPKWRKLAMPNARRNATLMPIKWLEKLRTHLTISLGIARIIMMFILQIMTQNTITSIESPWMLWMFKKLSIKSNDLRKRRKSHGGGPKMRGIQIPPLLMLWRENLDFQRIHQLEFLRALMLKRLFLMLLQSMPNQPSNQDLSKHTTEPGHKWKLTFDRVASKCEITFL